MATSATHNIRNTYENENDAMNDLNRRKWFARLRDGDFNLQDLFLNFDYRQALKAAEDTNNYSKIYVRITLIKCSIKNEIIYIGKVKKRGTKT